MRRVALLLALASGAAFAEEAVPPALALKVMLKVLSYDPALSSHGSGDFVVAVPFAPGQDDAAQALVREATALDVKSVNDRPLKFLAVATRDAEAKKPTAVLLLNALPIEARAETLKWSRSAKVYSLALDAAAVSEGALLGVGVANGKPQPVINATTAKALNADFKAVLRLARVVQ